MPFVILPGHTNGECLCFSFTKDTRQANYVHWFVIKSNAMGSSYCPTGMGVRNVLDSISGRWESLICYCFYKVFRLMWHYITLRMHGLPLFWWFRNKLWNAQIRTVRNAWRGSYRDAACVGTGGEGAAEHVPPGTPSGGCVGRVDSAIVVLV